MSDVNSSGDNNNQTTSGSDDNSVAYDTHRKLLGEKKALQGKFQEQSARLAELEAQIEQQKTTQLEEQKKYQQLYESEKEKRSSIEQQFGALNQSIADNMKKSALRDALGGKVKDAYLGLTDLNSITIDESGSIDMESVNMAATKFKELYPEALGTPSNDVPGTTSQPPGSMGQKQLSIQDLAKLSSEQRHALLAEAIKREGN